MGVPLIHKDDLIGMVTLSWTKPNYFTEEHARLARAFADQAAIAIENARLYEHGQSLAALEERQRLARELHDSVSQALYGIALGARAARTQLGRDTAKVAEPLEYVLSLAEAGLAEMRALIFELRPDSLETEGLVAAIIKQASAVKVRYGIEVDFPEPDEPETSLDVKEAAYRVTQEALNNVVKHSKATRVSIALGTSNGTLALSVTDDGTGFDPSADYAGHLGLKSMRERAERAGGKLTINSAPGKGSTISLELPVRR
jgi:signal transduction histidine kinase